MNMALILGALGIDPDELKALVEQAAPLLDVPERLERIERSLDSLVELLLATGLLQIPAPVDGALERHSPQPTT